MDWKISLITALFIPWTLLNDYVVNHFCFLVTCLRLSYSAVFGFLRATFRILTILYSTPTRVVALLFGCILIPWLGFLWKHLYESLWGTPGFGSWAETGYSVHNTSWWYSSTVWNSLSSICRCSSSINIINTCWKNEVNLLNLLRRVLLVSVIGCLRAWCA